MQQYYFFVCNTTTFLSATSLYARLLIHVWALYAQINKHLVVVNTADTITKLVARFCGLG